MTDVMIGVVARRQQVPVAIHLQNSITNGQSNLTQDRIAAAYGRLKPIRQVAAMCTPI